MSFFRKHIGLNSKYILKHLKYNEKNFIKNIIPKNIFYNPKKFNPITEIDISNNLKKMFNHKNEKYLIGLDFNDSILQGVIKRNILENPKWYTPYTPYQSEISQGRLESLFNYQTLISEITSLPLSNCSLLDSGSASTEAFNMAYMYHKKKKNSFFIDSNIHPHIKEILKTRGKIIDVDIIENTLGNIKISDDLFGAIFSYPDTNGNIYLFEDIIKDLNKNNITTISHNDIMSLMILKSPGELGIDISIGTTQRFGLPLWYGGPHSAFIATKDKYLRFIPGRIVGETTDRNGEKCFRLALQTREQHIKKEKALSNICTSQALLANVSSMYAINHGKEKLIKISEDIHLKTKTVKFFLNKTFKLDNNVNFYDTLKILDKSLYNTLKINDYITRLHKDGVSISLNEKTTFEDCLEIINICNKIDTLKNFNMFLDNFIKPVTKEIFEEKYKEFENEDFYKQDLRRNEDFLNQKIFKKEKSETEMLRYINYLSNKDYSLVNGMIPLGSCTMKLNATTQLEPLSWDSIQNNHPFSNEIPKGYKIMISELSEYLLNITNMKAISYQSNAGSLGEYTGLLCIKKYHKSLGEENRNICLISSSAHGTNFASCNLSGLKIMKYDDKISLSEFEELVKKHSKNLSSLMITYPNTYGIFDKNIKEIISIIHENGGLVYMDGANMNAQTGLTSPGSCGADVCHLNLHKTFCIPHGGGGPGMGPICVNSKLEKFLPSNIITDKDYNKKETIGMITSSQYSSASLLVIPYIYLKNMGSEGIKKASIAAMLSSNYLKKELEPYYKIYTENENGLVGHEFIIDLSEFKEFGITDKDISKRLIDYSFHPPTMSWPIPNSLMIEPTESENIEELDRFVEAMISIYNEIQEVKENKYSKENNVLVNSPHSYSDLIDWKFSYSMEKAFFPLPNLRKNKTWPTNPRIDDIYGDRNLKIKIENE